MLMPGNNAFQPRCDDTARRVATIYFETFPPLTGEMAMPSGALVITPPTGLARSKGQQTLHAFDDGKCPANLRTCAKTYAATALHRVDTHIAPTRTPPFRPYRCD